MMSSPLLRAESGYVSAMSAFGGKADVPSHYRHVRF